MGEIQDETGKSSGPPFFADTETMEDDPVVYKTAWPSIPEQADTLYDPEETGLSVIERLLVLVPDQDVDTVAFAQKLWRLASPVQLAILLVTVVPNPDYLPAAQRRLLAIAAITRDRQVKVDTLVVHGKTWTEVVQSMRLPNDLIVCHAEQTIHVRFAQSQALAASLVSVLHQPVLVISGLYPWIKPLRPKWLAQVPYWLILVTVIAGFFFIEGRADQSGSGWMEKTVVVVLFVLEVGLVWVWNSILG